MIFKYMQMKVLLSVFIVLFSSTAKALSVKNAKCIREDQLGLIYLNGVNNTLEVNVNESIRQIRDVLADESRQSLAGISYEDICINFLYNQTHGPLGIFDFVEVLGQKIREVKEANGETFEWSDVTKVLLEKKVDPEFFPDHNSISDFILDLQIAGVDKIAEYEEDTLVKITDKMLGIFKKIDPETGMSRGYLPSVVVSHSQGNLFANQLYDRMLSTSQVNLTEMSRYYANLQVGSAASLIKAPVNDYYTSKGDLVIDGALDISFDILPGNMEHFPISGVHDPLGHSFVKVYSDATTYGTFDEDILERGIYPYRKETLLPDGTGSGLFTTYTDKLELDGNVIDIASDQTGRFKEMDDIFYTKLNNLAKQIIDIPDCTGEKANIAVSFEFDQERNNKDGYTKRVAKAFIGKNVDDAFSQSGVSQSDYKVRGYYTDASTSELKSFYVGAGEEYPQFLTYPHGLDIIYDGSEGHCLAKKIEYSVYSTVSGRRGLVQVTNRPGSPVTAKAVVQANNINFELESVSVNGEPLQLEADKLSYDISVTNLYSNSITMSYRFPNDRDIFAKSHYKEEFFSYLETNPQINYSVAKTPGHLIDIFLPEFSSPYETRVGGVVMHGDESISSVWGTTSIYIRYLLCLQYPEDKYDLYLYEHTNNGSLYFPRKLALENICGLEDGTHDYMYPLE